MRSQSKERMQPIEDELVAFFAGRGLSLRIPILYRVKRFDKSPHNLKPGPRKQHFDLTVYIDFHDDNIARDNILRITAFPHACIDELPMAEPNQVHLHLPKADLDKIDPKFLFIDIDDLKENYFKRFWHHRA